jgi:hypothetical protein
MPAERGIRYQSSCEIGSFFADESACDDKTPANMPFERGIPAAKNQGTGCLALSPTLRSGLLLGLEYPSFASSTSAGDENPVKSS